MINFNASLSGNGSLYSSTYGPEMILGVITGSYFSGNISAYNTICGGWALFQNRTSTLTYSGVYIVPSGDNKYLADVMLVVLVYWNFNYK